MNILVLKKQALHEVGGDESLFETPYGVTQEFDETDESEVIKVIQNTTIYMENIVFKDPSYTDVKKTCKNRDSRCARWTTWGECEKVGEMILSMCIMFLPHKMLPYFVCRTQFTCKSFVHHLVARAIV
jgi:hypothetical protein